MTDQNRKDTAPSADERGAAIQSAQDLQEWETPRLEDVSEQVMAQPYIRFT
jgi:hypothetical protein